MQKSYKTNKLAFGILVALGEDIETHPGGKMTLEIRKRRI